MIYESIDTVRGKKYETPKDFSICNFVNVNLDGYKDFIEHPITFLLKRLKNESKNRINFYFKIYSTDPAILNASDFWELKFGKQGNETENRNREVIKSLERDKARISQQDLRNKNEELHALGSLIIAPYNYFWKSSSPFTFLFKSYPPTPPC